jgi:hypothetical protein
MISPSGVRGPVVSRRGPCRRCSPSPSESSPRLRLRVIPTAAAITAPIIRSTSGLRRMLLEPSPPPPLPPWSEARATAFGGLDAFLFFAGCWASRACAPLLAAGSVWLPVLGEFLEAPGEAPEPRADLSILYSLPELPAPEAGSFGRYSSPADAANADEANASDAVSASARVAWNPRFVSVFGGRRKVGICPPDCVGILWPRSSDNTPAPVLLRPRSS